MKVEKSIRHNGLIFGINTVYSDCIYLVQNKQLLPGIGVVDGFGNIKFCIGHGEDKNDKIRSVELNFSYAEFSDLITKTRLFKYKEKFTSKN